MLPRKLALGLERQAGGAILAATLSQFNGRRAAHRGAVAATGRRTPIPPLGSATGPQG